jgi:hypothetical protein
MYRVALLARDASTWQNTVTALQSVIRMLERALSNMLQVSSVQLLRNHVIRPRCMTLELTALCKLAVARLLDGRLRSHHQSQPNH